MSETSNNEANSDAQTFRAPDSMSNITAFEQVTYAKEGVEGAGPDHVYGVDDQGNKVHLSHEAVLEAYGHPSREAEEASVLSSTFKERQEDPRLNKRYQELISADTSEEPQSTESDRPTKLSSSYLKKLMDGGEIGAKRKAAIEAKKDTQGLGGEKAEQHRAKAEELEAKRARRTEAVEAKKKAEAHREAVIDEMKRSRAEKATDELKDSVEEHGTKGAEYRQKRLDLQEKKAAEKEAEKRAWQERMGVKPKEVREKTTDELKDEALNEGDFDKYFDAEESAREGTSVEPETSESDYNPFVDGKYSDYLKESPAERQARRGSARQQLDSALESLDQKHQQEAQDRLNNDIRQAIETEDPRYPGLNALAERKARAEEAKSRQRKASQEAAIGSIVPNLEEDYSPAESNDDLPVALRPDNDGMFRVPVGDHTDRVRVFQDEEAALRYEEEKNNDKPLKVELSPERDFVDDDPEAIAKALGLVDDQIGEVREEAVTEDSVEKSTSVKEFIANRWKSLRERFGKENPKPEQKRRRRTLMLGSTILALAVTGGAIIATNSAGNSTESATTPATVTVEGFDTDVFDSNSIIKEADFDAIKAQTKLEEFAAALDTPEKRENFDRMIKHAEKIRQAHPYWDEASVQKQLVKDMEEAAVQIKIQNSKPLG